MSWPTVPLSSAFEFIRNGMNVKQVPDAGGLPITRIETISDGTINPGKVGFAGLEYPESSRWILRSGDILFSHINSFEHVGKCAVYRGEPEELVHGMNLLCFRPDQGRITSEYAKHLLRSKRFRIQLERFINKAVNQASVSIGNLSSIPVELPPLEEQGRIAAILDQAEELRAKRRAAIALLDQLPQAIFLDMFGDPATNPMGWPIRCVGDLLESANYGTSGKAGGVGKWPILRMGNLTTEGHLDLSELKYIDLSPAEVPKYTVEKGDVLFNRTNSSDLVGKTALYNLDQRMAYAGYLVRLRVAEPVAPEFLAVFMNLAYTKKVLRGMAKSIVGMANINAKEVQTITLPVPDVSLQHEFASRVKGINRTKVIHQSALVELEALFSSLQSKAFEGDMHSTKELRHV